MANCLSGLTLWEKGPLMLRAKARPHARDGAVCDDGWIESLETSSRVSSGLDTYERSAVREEPDKTQTVMRIKADMIENML